MTTPGRRPAGRKRTRTHGLHALKAAVRGLGGRIIDRRTTLGKALAAFRCDLLQDLGGEASVSTQQAALVDVAVRTKLILDSIDTWLLVQPSLVNARRRSAYPVVLQRTAIADSLGRTLERLGLERRMPAAPSLAGYLAARTTPTAPGNGSGVSTPSDTALPPVEPVQAPPVEPVAVGQAKDGARACAVVGTPEVTT